MSQIYVALDVPTWKEAEEFLIRHDLSGIPVKVGMELFYREGPDLMKRLKEMDHKIFLDLKLHDIPMTVYKAMKNLGKLGVDLVNIHALGGVEMMKRAKEGLLEGSHSSNPPQLLAVTILTSYDEDHLEKELLIKTPLQNYVTHLARLSQKSGCDGVVCSVHEVETIKQECGLDFLTVTPGIRLKGNQAHDQSRIATPLNAGKMGVDKLVVGRAITSANEPKTAYHQVRKEWENGREKFSERFIND